jgi:ABC-type polysaccharide/polyol phosphate transport system ATPase subunit
MGEILKKLEGGDRRSIGRANEVVEVHPSYVSPIHFEMRDVGKSYGERIVLRDINLSFYYGAKIGVVGENGSGKSTLLRIMAGIDKDSRRHGRPGQGDAGPLRGPGAAAGAGPDGPRELCGRR